MKPPMETHRPRMNDRQVRYLTGLSSRVRLSFSTVVESARAGVAAWEENWDSAFPDLILSIKVETPIFNRPTMDKINRRWKEKGGERTGAGELNSPGVAWEVSGVALSLGVPWVRSIRSMERYGDVL